jgi:hypothetical protein
MTVENAQNIRSYKKKKKKKKNKLGHVKFLIWLGMEIVIRNKIHASYQQRRRAYIRKQSLINTHANIYCIVCGTDNYDVLTLFDF